MTTTANLIRATAVVLFAAAIAPAQEPPAEMLGSDPASYIAVSPGSAVEKEITPAGPVTPEPVWDGAKPFDPDMHAPVFPDGVLPQDLLDALKPAAIASFRLMDASVQEISLIDHQGEKLLAISLPEGPRIVRLHEYSMRDPDAQLKVQVAGGRIIDAEWPAPTTYRGTIDAAPEYEVAASILDDKVSLFIMPADVESPAWFLQPLSDALAGAPRGVHVLYRDADVIPSNFECGVGMDGVDVPAPHDPPLNGPAALARRAPAITDHLFTDKNHHGPGDEAVSIRSSGDGPLAVANVRCQIALDADYEFYLASGSSVLTTIYEMERLFNFVSLNYQGQVGISYTETFIIIRTDVNDPYTTGQTGPAMRDQFRNHWIANHAGVTRDVAHLFSNRTATDGFIGFAYFAGICNANNGANSGYEWSGTYYSTLLADRVGLVSHELGHVWNACHCNDSGCTGGATDGDCGIMNSTITGSWTFGTRAVNAIVAHRDSRPCLDPWFNPTYVNWAYAGAETGSITQPWNTIFEGLDACLVGGTLNVAGGNYFQNPNIFKAKNIFTTGGTVRIGSN